MIGKIDLDFEKKHIWHPYSKLNKNTPNFPVVKANGVCITLNDGQQLIDGMSSWWCVIHGYNHPKINSAIKKQVDNFSHIMFGGLTHKPAIDLGKKLIAMTPFSLDTVFFSDSGSVSIEVAIKMAIQYWYAKKQKDKTKILTFKGGYYGDTTGAMSVCDPINGMHFMFKDILPKHYFMSKPKCKFHEKFEENHIEEFKKFIQKHHRSIASVIIEPIVQGAGGMHFYSPRFLKRVRELSDEYNILLIHDEIATGFGRTGKLFASEYSNTTPDIMTVGKALTGGYMSLAATLCTQKISQEISRYGFFMHGPTFMANPLACAAANASLDLINNGNWKTQVPKIEKLLKKGLEPCFEIDSVQDVRIIGAIGVVEMREAIDMEKIQPLFVKEGVWIRPFGKLIYIMPSFIIKEDSLNFLCEKILKVIKSIK